MVGDQNLRNEKRDGLKFVLAVVAAIVITIVIVVLALLQGGKATEEKEGKEGAQKENQVLRADLGVHKQLAEGISATCEKSKKSAERLNKAVGYDVCRKAKEIEESTPPPPAPGVAGRGIVGTEIVGGRLLITYSDGDVDDVGEVEGERGRPGQADDGEDGRSIVSSQLIDNALVLLYSDGTRSNVGTVVGRTGPSGRGIASMTISPDFHLIITYTDSTTEDIGALPAGPQGDTGARGPRGIGVTRVYFQRNDNGECRTMNERTNPDTENSEQVDVGPAGDSACPPVPPPDEDPPGEGGNGDGPLGGN